MRSLPYWGAPLLLAAPLGAWALGLGDIELQSSLNQPFQAEIRLLSATPEELEGLQVGLASRETFERYGLDRPAELSALVFRVARNGSGQDVIRISSRDSMADPFLTMLVEVTWPRGRRLREYTVLLDPPLFNPELGAEPPVRQAQTSSPQPSTAGGAIARTPLPAPAASAAAPAAARSQVTSQTGGSYGPVQPAETLWNIASQLRPDDVSVNQMMVALYESNPRAFDGNMNILRSGTTLTVPERDRLLAMTSAAATAEVRRHETSWQPGGQAEPVQAEPQQARLRLVPTVTEDSPGAGAGTGAASAAGTGQTSATSDADVQRLEGEVAALRSELENSRRLLELRNEQLQELQARLGDDEQQAAEAPPAAAAMPAAPGVDLESEQVFTDESESPVAATDPEPQPEPAAVEPAPAAAAAASASGAAAAQTASEASLLSRVLSWISNPLLLIGFGVGAMLLTAVWYLRHRREEDEDVTGRWEALEAEAQDDTFNEDTARLSRQVQDDSLVVDEAPRSRAVLDDASSFGSGAKATPDLDVIDDTLSSQSVINLDQADFLAEADFHMAYGLYDQAAELVSKAIEKEPGRRDLRLKLLEVYFVWGNKEAFLDAARALRAESGDQSDGDWDKVLIMGKQICPDEPMFAESAAGGAVDLDLHGDGSTELDFAFDEKESADLDLDFGSAGDSEVDLELAATGERMGSDEDDDDVEYDFGESLDIGAQTAAGLEAALFQDDDQDDHDADSSDGNSYGSRFDTDTELDGLAETQESPTVENPRSGMDDAWSAFNIDSDTIEEPLSQDSPTVETPTMETMAAEAPTVETFGPDAPTVETPTIETPYGGTARMKAPELASEMFRVEQTGINAGEHTEEIDLDDLGLSLGDLADLPDDIGELPRADDGDSDTREQPALVIDDDDDLLSATGVTQVLTDDDELEHMSTALLSDQEATMLAPGYGYAEDTLSGTEVIGTADSGSDLSGDTSRLTVLDDDAFGAEDPGYGGNGLDLDLEDLAAALQGGDTVEQPGKTSFEHDVFGGDGSTPIDLDIGADFSSNDDPTGTEDAIGMDPQTMTEIGTKLDLARAYIDMGDPEGARSILEEVLDEGDVGQKREAQGLIDVLTA